MIIKPLTKSFLLFLTLLCLLSPLTAYAFESPVTNVLDELVASLCEGRSYEELSALNDDAILTALTPEQRNVLSTDYWTFDVNVPVIVSVMRHEEQPVPPLLAFGKRFRQNRYDGQKRGIYLRGLAEAFSCGTYRPGH